MIVFNKVPRATRRKVRRIIAGVVITGLLGCTPPPLAPQEQAQLRFSEADKQSLLAALPNNTPSQFATRKGIDAFAKGDYNAASQSFNLALKLDPSNSYLHFLNGLAYQLRAVSGDVKQTPFAEAAYLQALEHDAHNYLAAQQLGRLYFDNKQYQRAQLYFAYALTADEGNSGLYQELAVTSYYARDLKLALWASNNAKRLSPDEPHILRTASFIQTLAGQDDQVEEDVKRYEAVTHSSGKSVGWKGRLDHLRVEREKGLLINVADTPPPSAAEPSLPMMGAGLLPGGPDIPGPAMPGSVPNAAMPGSPGEAPHAAGQSWLSCDAAAAGGSMGGMPSMSSSMPPMPGGSSGGGSAGGDETGPLSALPMPCPGMTPKMALIDVVIINTEETHNKSYGINLLGSLEAVLNGSIVRSTNTGSAAEVPGENNTKSWSLLLGNTTTTGINYSLNMANAVDDANHIIAQPTLVVLDRKPSEFFSGSDLSISLSGQYGGNMVEKSTGVSLSVTPTFVDHERVLLAVDTALSYFEPQNSFTAQVGSAFQTSRNTTQTNVLLKFDQTLILSGLDERESSSQNSRTPLLGETPGVQYLFSTQTHAKNSVSILILLTPRRPAHENELPKPSDPPATLPSIRILRALAHKEVAPNSNLNAISHALSSNPFYLAYRAGDMKLIHWASPDSLNDILEDTLNLMYY